MRVEESRQKNAKTLDSNEREDQVLTGIRLDIDAPFGGLEVEGFESTLTTEILDLVNKLVSTVVSCSRKT